MLLVTLLLYGRVDEGFDLGGWAATVVAESVAFVPGAPWSATGDALLVRMPSSQVGPLAQGPTSLVKGLCASGSADEVLVIALAVLTYGERCGGADEHGHSLEDFMQAVEGFSHGYVEGAVCRTPLSWTGKDKWIVAYLKAACRVSANDVANTRSVAFGAAVVEHGGGVAYEPTKAGLEHYFIPLTRAKDSKGWLAGVPTARGQGSGRHGSRTSRRASSRCCTRRAARSSRSCSRPTTFRSAPTTRRTPQRRRACSRRRARLPISGPFIAKAP